VKEKLEPLPLLLDCDAMRSLQVSVGSSFFHTGYHKTLKDVKVLVGDDRLKGGRALRESRLSHHLAGDEGEKPHICRPGQKALRGMKNMNGRGLARNGNSLGVPAMEGNPVEKIRGRGQLIKR